MLKLIFVLIQLSEMDEAGRIKNSPETYSEPSQNGVFRENN